MASIKVLKPTQPVNLLNTPIAPKPYTLSYYDWLSTQGRRINTYASGFANGVDTTFGAIISILKSEVLFITSCTLGGSFGTLVANDGKVWLTTNIGKIRFMYLWMESVNNAAIPLVETKTFNIPLRIDGGDFVDMTAEADLQVWCNIQGFIVPKSLLFN